VQARLAAILLTAMYASFTPLVHIPMLLADPSKQFIWSENALNLVLVGVAWVVADRSRIPEGGGMTRRFLLFALVLPLGLVSRRAVRRALVYTVRLRQLPPSDP
jgi:hypothetical protein